MTTSTRAGGPAAVKMVGWYEPGQLLKTALDVVFSTTLGRHADNRRAQALTPMPSPYIDLSGRDHLDDEGSFWLDYVADCGDGGSSTYAVAAGVAAPTCNGLPRASLLVFGGDQVYPGASRKHYDERLVAPYQEALPTPPQPQPAVLAIPGNHDWYDSLASFTRLFCSGEDFAAWKTRQSHSYFAAKLAGGWWLLGVDVQLDHDINLLQLKYFRDQITAREIQPDDKVIICCPEPFWITEELERRRGLEITKTNLQKLIDALGSRLRLTVAGDLHHYRRHSGPNETQWITCGCGGAFTHPTHDSLPARLRSDLRHETSFPPSETSRRMARGNFLFLFKNPQFGVLTGLLYLMIAWGLGTHMGERFASGVEIEEIGRIPITEPLRIARAAAHTALINQVSMGFILVLILGFVLFTDGRYRRFRWFGGIAHAVIHLVAASFVYWLATYLLITVWGLQPKAMLQYFFAGWIIVPAGWILGSVIMGLYLWLSLNLFGQHPNEAFSSLKIQDWKGFLRMRVSKEGTLDVHFIGIREVPRKWQRGPAGGPRWVAADGRGSCEIVDRVSLS